MEIIERIENLIATPEGKSFESEGINPTFYWAYRNTRRTENKLLDFDDVIWEKDVPDIVKNLKEFGITEFTISNRYSGLVDVLALFVAEGCTIEGTTQVQAYYMNFSTGKPEILNAILVKAD